MNPSGNGGWVLDDGEFPGAVSAGLSRSFVATGTPDMPSMDIGENPYASPSFASPPRPVVDVRRAAVRIFRVMGWAGVGYITLILVIAFAFMLAEGRPRLGIMVGMTLECAAFLAFFSLMIRTASRLDVDLTGTYRRARWMAILAASVFFPVMTLPGILAVRRLERYRSHVVEPSRCET